MSEKQRSEELFVLSPGTKAGLYVQTGYEKVIVPQEGKMHIAACQGEAGREKERLRDGRWEGGQISLDGGREVGGGLAVGSPRAPTSALVAAGQRKQS